MTYKKFCNRCGKEMDEAGSDNELYFTAKRHSRYGYDDKLNLCNDCLVDFNEKFMNGGK